MQPLGIVFKFLRYALVRQCDTARIQHGSRGGIPRSVFVVTYQRESPGGKLHPYLMASSGVQADADK